MLLFTQELARRLSPRGLCAFSLRPGVTNFNLTGGLGQFDFDALDLLGGEPLRACRRH